MPQAFALEADVETLVNIGDEVTFPAGRYVVRAGEVNENIYIITSGVWRNTVSRTVKRPLSGSVLQGKSLFPFGDM